VSPASGGAVPRPSGDSATVFAKLVPDDPAVTARPMFGNPAAFVNGNLFTGLFGNDLFVRLSDDDGARLRAVGGSDFAPMPGRPMKGYTVLPAGWTTDLGAARRWIDSSLEWSRALPAKSPRAGGGTRRQR
jgi:TfoX/Sxy family transcriptional regulator of competence genes